MKSKIILLMLFFSFTTTLLGCTDTIEKASPQPSLTATATDIFVIQETYIDTPTPISQISTPTRTPPPLFNTPIPITPIPTKPSFNPLTDILPIGGIETSKLTDIELNFLADTNTAWWRRNGVFWADIEPIEGTRDWSAMRNLENELILASENGFTTILIIRKTPQWAQDIYNTACGRIKPEKLEAFASFMSDLVTRYSAPPYNVKYWELWNEPDISPNSVSGNSQYGCWGDETSLYYGGDYYGEMLKTVYPAIKAADPSAQVVIGGLLLDCDPLNPPETSPGSGKIKDCRSATFLEGILNHSGGDYFDGISFHAYDYYYGSLGLYGNPNWNSNWEYGPVVIAKTIFIKELLEKYGVSDKFLMNTETALLCNRGCSTDDFVQTKTSYLIQSYSAARAIGLKANIWYSLRGWRHSGLLSVNGTPTETLAAYKFTLDMLNHAQPEGYENQKDTIIYKFNNQHGELWVTWSYSKAQKTVLTFLTPPSKVFNAIGMEIPVTQQIELSPHPVYILWEK